MRPYLLIQLLFYLILSHAALAAGDTPAPLAFASGVKQTILLELYTSEGCSSCPPADAWLGQLQHDSRLWERIVPLAFHVDYWDYLGWQDKFAKPAYSSRQRRYAANGFARTVYTPGFFANGREWRGWFNARSLQYDQTTDVGPLQVSVSADSVTASFRPIAELDSPLILNVAMLGFDISSPVRGGENQGKNLLHDFVVLSLHQLEAQPERSVYQWTTQYNVDDYAQRGQNALAVWISAVDDPTPIQATGAWLGTPQ